MRTIATGSIALAVVLAAGGICSAQMVVKKEPMEGQLRTGATVLVDDGSCGKGKIKLVTVTHGNAMPSAPLRAEKCIPK